MARGLVGRGDLQPELLDDTPDLGDLLGIALGQFAWPIIRLSSRPTRTLPPRIAAMLASGICWPPAPSAGEVIGIAQQPVGGRLHVHQIFRRGAGAAQHAEHELHIERRLHDALAQVIGQRFDMADIVAFEFEARAVAVAQLFDDVFDILEGVLEDGLARGVEQLRLPIVLPVAIARFRAERCRNSSSPY